MLRINVQHFWPQANWSTIQSKATRRPLVLISNLRGRGGRHSFFRLTGLHFTDPEGWNDEGVQTQVFPLAGVRDNNSTRASSVLLT